jgi:hypothetical protein
MHLFQEKAPLDHDAALAQLAILDLGPYLEGREDALARLANKIRQRVRTVAALSRTAAIGKAKTTA